MIATERRSCTLLLVEDSRDEVFFMRRAWSTQPSHYHLVHAADGAEAKAFLMGAQEGLGDQGNELPRIILSDLAMPHCDGLALLSWVRSQPLLQAIPFVIWSTSQYQNDIDAAYARGANGYVFKPRSPDEEIAMIAAIQHFWCENNISPEKMYLPRPR